MTKKRYIIPTAETVIVSCRRAVADKTPWDPHPGEDPVVPPDWEDLLITGSEGRTQDAKPLQTDDEDTTTDDWRWGNIWSD